MPVGSGTDEPIDKLMQMRSEIGKFLIKMQNEESEDHERIRHLAEQWNVQNALNDEVP